MSFYYEAAKAGLSIYSALQASKGQENANESQQVFNAAEAQKQRDFEERMATTRYQYTRRDLEAAGYNPLLALNMNPPVPSGASASANPQSTTGESSKILASTASELSNISLQGAQRRHAAAQAVSAEAAARIQKQDADIATSKWGKRLTAFRFGLDKTGAGKAAANVLGFVGAGRFIPKGGSIHFGNQSSGFYGRSKRKRGGVY